MTQRATQTLEDAEAFRTELRRLLVDAHRDGIDLERLWACRTGEAALDWEVEVVRLAAEGED
jgi:RNAse (barnase) inhibitor barstar